MDEEYDVIVLGTGFEEWVDVRREKEDEREITDYGGESASLTLDQLWKRERDGGDPPKEKYGRPREWNIDLVPKFLMASGKLVQTLLYTGVNRYLDFKVVDGSFVLKGDKLHKVPSNNTEAVSSGLMSFFEKRRMGKMLNYVAQYDQAKPETHHGLDCAKATMLELYAKYNLGEDTIDFIGHALALHRDEKYMDEPALDTMKRINLYVDSKFRYEGMSPYLYPLFGLGELPQAFARLSAIHGGTYMLNKPVDELVFDESGHICGVKSQGETAKCKALVCDPTYVPDMVRKTGQVVRCICLMNHPVPGTNDAPAAQIILPHKQVGRKSNIYISVASTSHKISPKGMYVGLVSTMVETDHPLKELEPGMNMLGEVLERFPMVSDVFEPLEDGTKNGVFITRSYDATTHFETACEDILDVYLRYFGTPLDLSSKNPALLQEEAE